MTASLLYRIASGLLVLYAAGHTLGFRRVEPGWGVDTFINGLRTTRFTIQGAQRTYWGFYVGFGLFCSVFLLFGAVLAWQLGSLPQATLAAMPIATWGFAIAYAVATIVTWRYFFVAPTVFSILVTLCLVGAAWVS